MSDVPAEPAQPCAAATVLDAVAGVPGWYELPQIALNEYFIGLTHYPPLRMTGDLAEIGVHQGRSAIHLAMHLLPRQRLYLCDPSEHMAEVGRRVQAHAAGTVIAYRGLSQLLDETDIPNASCRFIRIDGEHSRRAIQHDMDLADRILRPNGIVNLDDFYNPVFAGLTAGLYAWLEQHPGRFEVLLAGFSQGYLCRPGFVNLYMHHMRGLPDHLRANGFADFSFNRSGPGSDCLTVGITGRRFDRDWLMEETDYNDPAGPGGRVLTW